MYFGIPFFENHFLPDWYQPYKMQTQGSAIHNVFAPQDDHPHLSSHIMHFAAWTAIEQGLRCRCKYRLQCR